MKLLDCLSEQGPHRSILPGFSPRPQQTKIAQAVEEAVRNGQKVIIGVPMKALPLEQGNHERTIGRS